jgi:hypothetical protein
MASYQRAKAQVIYFGMAVVGLYVTATETFSETADWKHQIVGPLLIIAGSALFFFGLNKP